MSHTWGTYTIFICNYYSHIELIALRSTVHGVTDAILSAIATAAMF